MRVSVVPGKLMLLIGKDTLKVLEARFNVLRESRAGHLMVPLLPESFWECHDLFVASETAGPMVSSTNGTFSVKRLPGSRTRRDLMTTSGRGSFQRLHRTFRRLSQKKGNCG